MANSADEKRLYYKSTLNCDNVSIVWTYNEKNMWILSVKWIINSYSQPAKK